MKKKPAPREVFCFIQHAGVEPGGPPPGRQAVQRQVSDIATTPDTAGVLCAETPGGYWCCPVSGDCINCQGRLFSTTKPLI